MKFYYYAFTGHRWGLDRVKRGVALIIALREKGIEVQLLVNDFRAGLVAKELGVRDTMTMETIMDIDMIANKEDIIFIDTSENENGRIERYSNEYEKIFHIVDSCDMKSRYGEIVMSPKNNELSSIIVDKIYFDIVDKIDRTLFFLGDADYNKRILSHSDFFKKNPMELLLGNYFFVKYEDDLEQIFTKLHEPEEYRELIRTSKRVVTASLQCALESRASLSEVIYLRQENDENCIIEELESFGITIIDGFNNNDLSLSFEKSKNMHKKVTNHIEEIAQKIVKMVNL